MKVETDKDTICVNKIVGEKAETVFVDNDVIIPDIKPDIVSSINTSGTICIYKKELMDGRVRIDGSVNTYIVYLSDGENESIRGLNTNLDFTQVLDLPEASAGMDLELEVNLKAVECKILNGRKVNVKAGMEFRMKVYSNENVQIVKNIAQVENVQMLNSDLSINSLVGMGETKTCGKETFVIDNIDNLAEVLNVNVRMMNKDQKISYNKVLAKAELDVKIMYLTEDNRVNTTQGTIPIMGFIDIPEVAENNLCDMKYMIKNMIVKPNDMEEHSIYVEIEVGISCHAYATKEINLIQDAYSPECDLSLTKKTVNTMTEMKSITNTYNMRQQISAGDVMGNKIYDVDAKSIVNQVSISNEMVMYEGEVSLNVLFASETVMGLETRNYRLPFTFNTPVSGASNQCNCSTEVEIRNDNFVLMPDGNIDLSIDMEFHTSLSKNVEINMIDQIEMEENRDIETYSIIIYFVRPNDTLWSIAKRFRSTVDDIVRINRIEDPNRIYPGQQLFIPRYVARRNIETA